MRRRRIRRFKGRLKKKTVFNIISILLLVVAGFIILSYSQEGPLLTEVRDFSQNLFGWAAVLFSFVLISISFYLFGLKTRFTQINVPIGLTVIFTSILTLTQSGQVGYEVWQTLAPLISAPGTVLLLFGALVIGFTVLFNTSLDELVELLITAGSAIGKVFQGVFMGKKKKRSNNSLLLLCQQKSTVQNCMTLWQISKPISIMYVYILELMSRMILITKTFWKLLQTR